MGRKKESTLLEPAAARDGWGRESGVCRGARACCAADPSGVFRRWLACVALFLPACAARATDSLPGQGQPHRAWWDSTLSPILLA